MHIWLWTLICRLSSAVLLCCGVECFALISWYTKSQFTLVMLQFFIVIVSTIPPEVIAVPPAACQAKASQTVQYRVGSMMHDALCLRHVDLAALEVKVRSSTHKWRDRNHGHGVRSLKRKSLVYNKSYLSPVPLPTRRYDATTPCSDPAQQSVRLM